VPTQNRIGLQGLRVAAVCATRDVRAFSSSSQAPGGAQGQDGLTLKERFQIMAKDYGKVILLSHSTIWAGSLAATFVALKSMDISQFIALLPGAIASHIDPSASAFAIAFVVVKLTGPGRLMIDLAITPMLARYLSSTWLAGPLGLDRRLGARRHSKLRYAFRGSMSDADKQMSMARENVRDRVSGSIAGAKTQVIASIRKSLPRLEWVRLRDRVSTPVSGNEPQYWSSRTWKALRQHLKSARPGKEAPKRAGMWYGAAKEEGGRGLGRDGLERRDYGGRGWFVAKVSK
jgi:hypothetical protein